MIYVEEIIESIRRTAKSSMDHQEYPTCPGIYSFILAASSTLGQFGIGGQIIYVGIAKDSLRNRDLNTHFKTGRTGHSTLRRSLGAILKSELKLSALTRNGTKDQTAIDNYKFAAEGDKRLSEWMAKNLKVGYWEDHHRYSYQDLRRLEEEVIKEIKPTLDLDIRTRRYNPLESTLDTLRKICKIEAVQSAEKPLDKSLKQL